MEKIDGLKLDGIIQMAEGETVDGLFDAFTDFLESRKCYFWGAHRGVDTSEDITSQNPYVPTPAPTKAMEAELIAFVNQLNSDPQYAKRKVVMQAFGDWKRDGVISIVHFVREHGGPFACYTYLLPEDHG